MWSWVTSTISRPSSSSMKRMVQSTVIGLPIIIWIHDTFFSFVRVNGKSMEPTLKDGDIVIVRKSDFTRYHNKIPKTLNEGSDGIIISSNNKNDNDLKKQRECQLRHKVLKYEATHCNNPSINVPTWFYSYPAIPLTNNIVVYCNPQEYYSNNNGGWKSKSPSLNIKRVVGLGGQVVRI